MFQTRVFDPEDPGPTVLRLRKTQMDLFIPDEFRWKPNFHFSLGFRLEANRLPNDLADRLARSFDQDHVRSVLNRVYGYCSPRLQSGCDAYSDALFEVWGRDLQTTFGSNRYRQSVL